MKYYPINLNIRGRACMVVGGGGVGTRKVMNLLKCGALVTVVDTILSEPLQAMAADGRIEWRNRLYSSSDPEKMFLVIGATNDEALNRRIHEDCESMGKLCNIADRPEVCNFILPAVVKRGDLLVTVSTSGKSPAFAKHLRKDLETYFGPEYADFLRLMGKIREKLLREEHAPEAHKPLFETLISGGLLQLVKNRDAARIDRLLSDTLGPGYEWRTLMAQPHAG